MSQTRQARKGSPLADHDHAAITEIIEAYADRLRSGDVAGVLDLYAEHAAVMAPDLPTTVGREELAAVYQGAFDAVAMDFRFEFDDIAVRGDIAVARTRTSGKNTIRATGEDVPSQFRELFVLQRRARGWKITEYMFQPMPDTRDAGR